MIEIIGHGIIECIHNKESPLLFVFTYPIQISWYVIKLEQINQREFPEKWSWGWTGWKDDVNMRI